MAPSKFRDYYADLGLKLGASLPTIKSAFHNIARQYHPDKSGASDATTFRLARDAYEQLSDSATRTAYDRDYWHFKMQTDGNDLENESVGYTRTTQYEAEQASSWSPPPTRPTHMPGQPSGRHFTGRLYNVWEKPRQDRGSQHPEGYDDNPFEGFGATRAVYKAHGLTVQMTSHPAAKQLCPCRTQYWRVQSGGQDHCIFCMSSHVGGSRCPGCEALACQKCLREVVELERNVLGGIRVST